MLGDVFREFGEIMGKYILDGRSLGSVRLSNNQIMRFYMYVL